MYVPGLNFLVGFRKQYEQLKCNWYVYMDMDLYNTSM